MARDKLRRRNKSVVLLSAGLDSTVNLVQATQKTETKMALTFNYGQRAARKEREFSEKIARLYRVPHRVIELPWLKNGKSALTDISKSIPEVKINELGKKDRMVQTAREVWVPNRNAIFVTIAAGFAEVIEANLVVTGFNAEEAETFPDNSAEFIRSMNKLLRSSIAGSVRVISYTQNLNKNEIAALGVKLKIPFEYLWSCYDGGATMCGRCESCQRLIRALENMNSLDLIKRRMNLSAS
jgi:7-cyano-7-deazaguanine synthase